MPIFYRIRRCAVAKQFQESPQGLQIRHANYGLVRQLHAATSGPVEHPLRHFQRPTRLAADKSTAENGARAPNHILKHLHLTAMPGMPGIEDLAKQRTLGFVS